MSLIGIACKRFIQDIAHTVHAISGCLEQNPDWEVIQIFSLKSD